MASVQLDILKREYKKFTILELYGEISTHSIVYFRTALQKLIQAQPLNLALDFIGISHLDSAGIGFLINLKKMINGQGGSYCLINFSESLYEMVEMSNIQQIVKVFHSEEEFQKGVNLLETSKEKIIW